MIGCAVLQLFLGVEHAVAHDPPDLVSVIRCLCAKCTLLELVLLLSLQAVLLLCGASSVVGDVSPKYGW